MSQYIQQAAFHNDNQFPLYDAEQVSKVVNSRQSPNFSLLLPFAAATPLNLTHWWHTLDRHAYNRQILISGSSFPKFLDIQSCWDMAWLVYQEKALKNSFNVWWVNLVDANFLSSTILINKQNYQLPGIHKTNWCKQWYSTCNWAVWGEGR